MVLQNGEINIIADMEGTTGVKLHNNRQKLRSRFDIVKKLGQGTYGKVQLAINKDTGEEVAIKTIKKSKIETEQDLVRIQREIQIMSSVQHPSIIHIYEVFENREKIVLVMEYASGGELYDYISYKKVLDEMEARRVFRQVAAAVFYCHKNMICHRDLKLENILLDERGCAKIADFGLSNVFDERNFLSTFCGSPLYASPEIVRGTPYYGPEVDCWSLGVLLYTLVYGAMPFDGSNFKKLVRQISEGDYYEPKAPSEASHLIRRMLTVDPAKRANIDDICCDVWVDMGEDTPLWEIAEEMCKQMPVRLDYLLTLTAATAAPSEASAELPLPPPLLPQSSQAANQEEEDADQWERPALQGSRAEMMTNDAAAAATVSNSETGISTNQEEMHDAKKHKLVTSSSTLADIQKKKKRDGDGVDELNDAENQTGVAEAIEESAEPVSAVVDPSGSNVSDTGNNEPMEGNISSDKNAGEATVASAMDADKVVSTADDTPTTFVRDSSPVKKRVSSIKRPSLTSASKLNKSVSEVSSNQTDTGTAKGTCNGGLSAMNKGGIRLKKSTTGVGSKDGIGGTGDAAAASDKRKLSFGSLRPVNEAKRAFEAKTTSTTAEVKPVIAVGKKILSARKAFESPPTTPEVSKIVKPPLTKKISDEAKPIKQDDASETATPDAKRPALVRQGSRKFGVPRATVSPTKTVRTQQHQGCVPHEAKVAAAEETKKTSNVPAKTVVCRRSPPSPGTSSESPTRKTSLTKAPSFTKLASAPRRTSAPGSSTNSRPSAISNAAIRPKSPVKTVKERSNVTESAPSGLPVARSEPEANGEQKPAGDQVDAEPCVDLLTKKIEAVDVSDSVLESPGLGKRGSIDIAPLPQPVLEESSPQISFVPRDKCQFTLVGVKSEVMFDVGDANCKSEVVETRDAEDRNTVEKPLAEEQNRDEGDNSKIIRYVATVRRHGSEDTSDAGPERVTLLNIRRSETGMSDASKDCETPDSGVADQAERDHQASPLSMKKAETNLQSNRYRQVSRTSEGGVLEERKAQVNESSVNTEQRGYSVYRSKYRSVQKYRSVVERRDSERATAAVQEGIGEDECDVPAGAIGQSQSNNVEHSDSFSSAGSTDELEDVFESLTSESLFTSLLNRTRNLIERIANDGDAHSSPFFQSSLLGRHFLGGSQSVTSNSAAMSLLLNPPTISFRRNPLNHGYNYNDPVSRSETRSPESDLGMRRWRPSRSSVREESKPSAFSGNIRLRARASFNSNDYNSSGGGSSSLTDSLSNRRHQSRYETFRSQEDSMTSSIADSANRRREEARSDIISALLRHRNRSLDGRRPRSLYDGSDDYLSTKSASPHDSNYQRGQDSSYLEEERQDVTMTNANDKASNLYGTIRRPNRYPRYTKSMTKEVNADEYDSSRSLRRPRSIHEILSNNLDVNINGGGDHDEDDSAATSMSRDYSKSGSKSVSRTGATKREEEEEFEREHRVTEDAVGGRSVTTTERQVSRSISQTEDDKSCSSSSVHVHTSSTLLQRRPAVNKKSSSDGDDGISRQDSGVGSLYDSVSQPSTVQSGIRRGGGVLSNDLGSLENEMSRIGLRRHQQQESAKHFGSEADGGEQMSGGASKTDGATTPASDSADTGSVCSDASGTATETSSSTMKASEEESVGERIRRKSFFARFNDTTARVPRKVRKPSTGSMSSSSAAATSSLRSDLSRSSSLRHRIFDDDAFTSRLHYDSPPDFYGTASRYNPQRWSMHPGNSGDPDFLAYEAGVPLSPRRSSFQSGDHLSYLRRPASGSWLEDNSGADNNPHPPCWRATSPMSRTHSLPEDESGVDGSDPRAMHRQTSVPGNAAGIPPASPARRPSHLGLYSTHLNPGHCEEADEWLSPESPSSMIRANSWSRPSTSSSAHQRPRMNSASRDQPPPESHRRLTASSLASSLMDNLDSPSEVLQKAMDLCDSLRYT